MKASGKETESEIKILEFEFHFFFVEKFYTTSKALKNHFQFVTADLTNNRILTKKSKKERKSSKLHENWIQNN